MLIHRYFCTNLQLAFLIRSSAVSLQDKVSPGMTRVQCFCLYEIRQLVNGHLC